MYFLTIYISRRYPQIPAGIPQLTEKGCLADEYASDGYCHIWTDGYKVWTAILRDYAVRKMNGTYTNPERMPLLGINK